MKSSIRNTLAAVLLSTLSINFAQAADTAQGKGLVKQVDGAAGIVNIAHEPIPALKWPGMTMDFKAKDKALLSTVKPGQKVNFDLVKDASGSYLITRIAVDK